MSKELKPKEGQWRDLKGYEGLYKISRKGEVKRLPVAFINKGGDLKSREERALKQWTKSNYNLKRVTLAKNGVVSNRGITILMVETYFDYDKTKRYEIMYKDGDLSNSALSNLRVFQK